MIEFNYEKGSVALPAAVAETVGRASETALRLLILLAADKALRENFESGADAAAKKLKCTRTELELALAFWNGAGITDTDSTGCPDDTQGERCDAEQPTQTPEKPERRSAKLMRAAGIPEYTSEELADMLEGNGGALGFVDESQRRIGRMFNPREVAILIGLRDYLELDENYIYILLDHCARVGKTSMRYVETMAFGMYDEGVTDADALKQRLTEREAYGELEGRFKAMVGARGRKLTAKETRFLNRWSVEMKYSFEMIEIAYEITADAQHEYNPAYMNGILERWYAAGITTPEQAQATRTSSSHPKDFGNSFDTNEFFEAALRRSYGDGDNDK